MRISRSLLIGAAAVFLLLGRDLRAANAPLTIVFGDHRVTVTGVRSRHTIVLFGVGTGTYSHSPLLTRYTQASADDDGDGAIDFNVRRLPATGVWMCVDLDDGDYAIATPNGAPVTQMRVPPGAWRAGGEHLDLGSNYLDAVVVRPRVGAWTLRIADGGPNDADAKVNGAARLRLDRMLPIAGTLSGPPFVTGRDIVLAVDCDTLDVYVRQAE